jgi:hypothetical protein
MVFVLDGAHRASAHFESFLSAFLERLPRRTLFVLARASLSGFPSPLLSSDFGRQIGRDELSAGSLRLSSF